MGYAVSLLKLAPFGFRDIGNPVSDIVTIAQRFLGVGHQSAAQSATRVMNLHDSGASITQYAQIVQSPFFNIVTMHTHSGDADERHAQQQPKHLPSADRSLRCHGARTRARARDTRASARFTGLSLVLGLTLVFLSHTNPNESNDQMIAD